MTTCMVIFQRIMTWGAYKSSMQWLFPELVG